MVYQWQVKLAYYSGSRISSTIFRPTAYKERKRISISCARTHTHACTHTHTHTPTMASLWWWHWLWPIPTISLISTSTCVAMAMHHTSVHIPPCHKNVQLTCSLLLATNLLKTVFPMHSPNRPPPVTHNLPSSHKSEKLVQPILASPWSKHLRNKPWDPTYVSLT